MNDKKLDSITDEILDCFTCDEEMMSEEGVLRRRIREVLGDKLIEKQNKNKVEPPNICPSEERGSFNAIENITGAISGQWATYALCAESVTRLKKKYKGSEWTIVNYSVNPYDKNFVQDEEMRIKLLKTYDSSYNGIEFIHEIYNLLFSKGYKTEHCPLITEQFMNSSFNRPKMVLSYDCDNFYRDGDARSNGISCTNTVVIRWTENQHPVLSLCTIIEPDNNAPYIITYDVTTYCDNNIHLEKITDDFISQVNRCKMQELN